MDFSIVVAHRGNPMGLWATIHSCEVDLANTNYKYEYIIVANGEKTLPQEDRVLRLQLETTGKLGEFIEYPEPMSPPTARQLGTEFSKGELLFFFDNHCLVARDYFKRAVLDFEHYGMDMLHSATVFYVGDQINYHYKLQLEKNFWAESAVIPEHNLKPYRIAAGGHGGFAVRRSVWQEVGGYWNGFTGYGGEEMYFDLKMALLDKTNWLDPRLIHYHYAGARGYRRHYTREYFTNMMMCANIIGGQKWMNRIAVNFQRSSKVGFDYSIYDCLQDATLRSRTHASEIAAIRKRTLDDQLRLFREQGVAFN